MWLLRAHRDVARKGRVRRLLLSPIPRALAAAAEAFVFCHRLHGGHVSCYDPDAIAVVSATSEKLVLTPSSSLSTSSNLHRSGHCNPTGNHTSLLIWCLLDIATDMLSPYPCLPYPAPLTPPTVLVIPLSVFWAPFPRVWKHQRLGFCFVFFFGSLSIFAAVGRFGMLFPTVLRNPNASIMTAYKLWAITEIAASQMTVCLPALRVVLRGHRKRKEGQNWNRPASSAAIGEWKEAEGSSLQELRVHGSHQEMSLQELQVHGSREEGI